MMFRVFHVDPNRADSTEPLGTKEKFWIEHDELGECLVKYPRENTGEDWSEKVVAELAEVIGLPHARYELALAGDRPATLSRNFVPKGAELVHGNELLQALVAGYDDSVPKFRASQHTVDLVLAVIEPPMMRPPIGWGGAAELKRAVEVFVGYLMLDAWISNTDRHHENWGVVVGEALLRLPGTSVCLAPTFDHASSLGCHELDAKKEKRLGGSDPRFTVRSYCEKARSALYRSPADARPLTTLDAFHQAAKRYPGAARWWLDSLAHISDSETAKLLEQVPSDRISATSRDFAQELLCVNRARLLALLDGL